MRKNTKTLLVQQHGIRTPITFAADKPKKLKVTCHVCHILTDSNVGSLLWEAYTKLFVLNLIHITANYPYNLVKLRRVGKVTLIFST